MKHKIFLGQLFLVASLVLCITSCNHTGHEHNHSSNESEQHAHVHDAKIIFTAYNNEWELFAESDPFVTNEPATIMAHFTHLSNFKPIESGKVKAILQIGSQKIEQTLDTPNHPGIYKFKITPTQKGDATLYFQVETENSSSNFVLSNVKVYDDEHTAHHTAEEKMPKASNGITFSKEKSWQIDFATELIEPQPFGEVIKTTAQIQPAQGDEQLIVAKTSGIVHFNNPVVTNGLKVQLGQRLFTIKSNKLANNNMDIKFQEAEANYEEAKSNYDRKKQLFKDQIVSQSDLLASESLYKKAKANFENIKNNFNKEGETVKASMTGFIKQLRVRNGSYVNEGEVILAISQNKNLFIEAQIQPRYYNTLKNITNATIYNSLTQKSYSLKELKGKIVSYGKTTSLENPLIPLTLQINNEIDWLPGSFVDLYLQASKGNNELSVPNSALVEEMGNYFLFVQITPELFEKRLIEKGATNGRYTLIKKGLQAGERIVSKGAIMVKLSQSAGALDPHAGHVH